MENLINKISKSTNEKRKIIFIHGKPMSGKSALAKILTFNIKAYKLDGKTGLNSKFYLDVISYFVKSPDCVVIDDLQLKLKSIEILNLIHVLSYSNIKRYRMFKYPITVNIKSVIVISEHHIDDIIAENNIDKEIKNRFTDIITINNQKEFFQFLADNEITISEVLNPFNHN